MFNFIVDCSDSDLKRLLAMAPEEAVNVFTRGDLNWCLQTYQILSKVSSLPMKCTNSLCDDSINLVHSDQLLNLRGKPSQFIVCVRADYPRRIWAHYHIVQNKKQLDSCTWYVPHWVQPGLVKRNPERRGVKRVAYAGETINGNLAGSESEWKRLLEPLGVEFVALKGGAWHNLHDVDVLMGIRSFSSETYDSKPPTKLFSAWHANIPFIGGMDSAFSQVGIPGEDYLLAHTPQEAVAAVRRLKNDESLYNRLVANSQSKALQFNETTISGMWLNMLTGPINERYQIWKVRPGIEQQRFKLNLSLGLAQHNIKQLVKPVLKKYLKK